MFFSFPSIVYRGIADSHGHIYPALFRVFSCNLLLPIVAFSNITSKKINSFSRILTFSHFSSDFGVLVSGNNRHEIRNLQIGMFYEEALAALSVAPLNQYFDKAWIAHVQLKAALYYGEACYPYSIELHQKEEIAEKIARLEGGVLALTQSKKSSHSGAHPQLLESINKLESSLNANLERAMKENDRVYLMPVLSASSLPPLPTYSLVEPLPMNDILDARKEKLFTSLVPDNGAKAVSRYTEMVDDVIRKQTEKLQQGSKLARVRPKEMDLPGLILALEGNLTLPVALKEDVEAVQICGGLTGLVQQLEDLKKVNHELLIDAHEELQKEVTEDARLRNDSNMRWTRPQFSTFTNNMQDRLNTFVENLKQAEECDARIERSLRKYLALLSILDCHSIESTLPRLARAVMYLDGNEDALVAGLKKSLVVISGVKQRLVVDAPKANDAIQFYKAAFGAEEVSRVSHRKRSAELKFGSSVFVVSDLTDDNSPPLKSAVTGDMYYHCLEVEDVEAAVAKSVAAGAIAEGEIYEGEGTLAMSRTHIATIG